VESRGPGLSTTCWTDPFPMDLCSERGDGLPGDRIFVGEALKANQVRMRVGEVEPWWCLSICLGIMSHAWKSRCMYGAAVVWLSRTHV
jgi:hypothetical protein